MSSKSTFITSVCTNNDLVDVYCPHPLAGNHLFVYVGIFVDFYPYDLLIRSLSFFYHPDCDHNLCPFSRDPSYDHRLAKNHASDLLEQAYPFLDFDSNCPVCHLL